MKEREYLLKTYALKALAAPLETMARPFWNRNSPEIGREVLNVAYGSESRRKQNLDVFVPKGDPPYPIITYIHGSGWHFLDKKSYRWLSKIYADKGYLVFNINHGLAPARRHKEQISDVSKAMCWVYDHAKEFGGDNSKIFLAGDSGGAYHSALYSGIINKPDVARKLGIERTIPNKSVKGLVLFYGVAGFDSAKHTRFPLRKIIGYGFIGYEAGKESEEFRHMAQLISPITHIDKDYPPTYIAAGELDPICQESLILDLFLTREGVSHKTRIFPKSRKFLNWVPLMGNHGFLMFPFSYMKRDAISESIDFLEDLKQKIPD